MKKEMRRKDRKFTEQETIDLLERGEYGILSTYGEDGYPYGVPVSYAYHEGMIYFHGAKGVGHKVENMNYHNKVCFTVVGNTQVLPEQFATIYESAIVFGTVSLAENKLEALELLQKKYSPDFAEKGKQYAISADKAVDVFALKIEEMTGKGRRK